MDTHTAIWYLFGDPRLSRTAKAFIDQSALSGRKVALSAISVAEIVYLVEKKRVDDRVLEALLRALGNPNHVFEEVPVIGSVAVAMRQVPRDEVPDMPDRLIAGTATFLGVPLVSRDGRIRSSHVLTIW